MVYIEDCDDVENCFLHRLNTYPIAAATMNSVRNGWDSVKNSTSITEKLCTSAENAYNTVTEAPIINPIYCMSSRIGAEALKGVEYMAPKTRELTPADVKQKFDSVYQGSAIQVPVEKTGQFYSAARGKAIQGADIIAYYYASLIGVFVAFVDRTEPYVEHYVGNDLESVKSTDNFYVRVFRMPYRLVLASGKKMQRYGQRSIAYVGESYDATKKMYSHAKAYAQEKSAKAYDTCAYYANVPSDLVLRGVKFSSSASANLTNAAYEFTSTSKYSPQFVVNTTSAVNTFVQDANQSAEKTDSVSELAKRLFNEAQFRFIQAKDAALYVADRFQSKAKTE